METPNEARETVFQILNGLTGDDGMQSLDEIYEAFNLTEFSGDIEDTVNGLCEATNQNEVKALMQGDFNRMLTSRGDAIFVAMLIGYRLGCSHTAERVTGGSDE